jgi:hypothetical protein
LENLTPQPGAQQQLDQTFARPKLNNNLVNAMPAARAPRSSMASR